MFLSSLQSEIVKTIAFTYRNFVITKRNVFTIFETLFWPIIGMLSVGLMSIYLQLGKPEVAFIIIGAISLSVLQVSQLDVAYVLLFDIWSKSLRYTFVAPISIANIILGSWLFGIVRGLIAFIVLVAFSKFMGFEILLSLAILLFLAGLFLSALIIGIMTCSLLLLFGYRAEISAWTLTAIFMLICGIYYPAFILPSPIKEIAYLIPLTHFLEYYRSFYGFKPLLENPLAFGFALSFLLIAILLLLFRWSLQRAMKRGMITQLSE